MGHPAAGRDPHPHKYFVFSASPSSLSVVIPYMLLRYMAAKSIVFDRELKKGSAELLVLSLLEQRDRHGYEIGKLIETRSGGALRFNVASLYPLLYRLEKRGWIDGRWVEKAGQRRPRTYRLTPRRRKGLTAQRSKGRGGVGGVAPGNRAAPPREAGGRGHHAGEGKT